MKQVQQLHLTAVETEPVNVKPVGRFSSMITIQAEYVIIAENIFMYGLLMKMIVRLNLAPAEQHVLILGVRVIVLLAIMIALSVEMQNLILKQSRRLNNEIRLYLNTLR